MKGGRERWNFARETMNWRVAFSKKLLPIEITLPIEIALAIGKALKAARL